MISPHAKGTSRRAAFVAVLTLASAPLACTSTLKSRDTDAAVQARLTEAEKKSLDEMKAEAEIGRNMAGRLLQVYGTVEDEGLVGYVNQVGNYVASYSDFPDRRYMFAVIQDEHVNAFACPGGYVLVTMGAIRNARNEAELASVLGHEVAHVGKKHMFNTLTSMSKEDIEKAAREVELAAKAPPEVKVRERPDPEESDVGSLMARYLSGSAAGLSILVAAKAGMSLIMEKGLGADLEYEADREGVKYAVRAGYAPKALNSFLCRIAQTKEGRSGRCRLPEEEAKKDPESILEKTHPPIRERIINVRRLLKELDADKIIGATGKARFEEFKAKLPPAVAKK